MGHGHILLTAEFISKSSSINHSSSSLLFRHLGRIAHLIHVSVKCAELILKLPLSSSNGLVLVGKVSQGFIAVSKFLLQRSAGTVSLFKHSSSFLKGILHGSSLPVSIDLGILGNSLHASFLINLDLGITNLVLVLLDGGLGFQSTSIGSFKSQVKFHDISFKFLLHSEGLSLALRFSLNSRLHRLKSLGLVLSDRQELLIFLSNAALNFSSDLGQFKLATENLVFFLFKSGLSFLKGSLQLKLFSLKALADFVNLVDGATTFTDLVHDVLDFIGQGLVFTADFIKLKHGLLIGRLDLEEVRRGISGFLLAAVKVIGERVNLSLPFSNNLVKLLGFSFHGRVENLSLVKVAHHLIKLSLHLSSGLLNLSKLGIQVLGGSLSLSKSGNKLHLGHFKFLSLGNSIIFILGSPHVGITLSLGHLTENIVSGGGLLIQGTSCSINLMLKVSEFSKQKGSLSCLIVSKRFNFLKLGSKRALDLHQHVEVVVNISSSSEKISIFSSNLPLAGLKVSKIEVSFSNLLVDVTKSSTKILVGLVRRSLGTHDFIGSSSGIIHFIDDVSLVLVNLALHLLKLVNLLSHLLNGILVLSSQIAEDGLLLNVGLFNILSELANFSFSLLVKFNLSIGCSSGLHQTFSQLLNFSGKVRSLPLSFQFLLHFFNSSLALLDVLLHLGNKRLFIIK